MTAPHLGAGQIVAGKYTLRSLLGFTAEMATYEAADGQGRAVALKLYDPALGQRADVMSRLEQTHKLVATLSPQLVVPVFDSGYDVGSSAPFTVCERLQVPSLAKLVATGPLSIDVVAAIMRGAALALDAAHASRIHHHAIKPTNIFVGPAPSYAVRVADFGASVVHSTSPTHEAYARAVPWWAPEQLQPAAVLGAATDVFALALVTFYALTGRSYWLSCQGSPPDLPRWQMEVMGPRVPASQRAVELGTSVPTCLDVAIARALCLNQRDRPASAMEIANALGAAGAAPTQAAAAVGAGLPPTALLPQMQYSPSGAAAAAPAMAPPTSGGQVESGANSPGGYAAVAPHATPSPALAPGRAAAAGVTPGLPPMPPAAPTRPSRSMLPVIIGVIVAVLVGGAGLVFLFVRSPNTETGPVAETASANAITPAPPASSSAAPTASGAPGGGAGGADAAAPSPRVSVMIKCLPTCGSLWIDNQSVERLDEPQMLLAGKHTIKVEKPGYSPRQDTIVVPPDRPFEREYRLVKLSGRHPKARPCGQFLRPCK